jgi:NitT/TauT family transport system permease protein
VSVESDIRGGAGTPAAGNADTEGTVGISPAVPRRGLAAVLAARLPLLKSTGYVVVSLGLTIGLWALVGWAGNVPEYELPSPASVFSRMFHTWSSQLMSATLVTGKETLIGFAVATVIAVPISVLITYSKVAENLLYPLLVSAQVIPKVAIAPLFVVWFGFGLMPKVLIAFLIAFFPIVIDTTVGLRSIDPAMLHLARSMGAGELQIFRKVRLPNGLPSFFGGLKVGVTLALIGAVVGEFVGSSDGLGYVLISATGNIDTPLVFSTILLMSFIGIVLFAALELVERFATPWHRARRAEGARSKS